LKKKKKTGLISIIAPPEKRSQKGGGGGGGKKSSEGTKFKKRVAQETMLAKGESLDRGGGSCFGQRIRDKQNTVFVTKEGGLVQKSRKETERDPRELTGKRGRQKKGNALLEGEEELKGGGGRNALPDQKSE